MKRLALASIVWLWAGAAPAASDEALDRCLNERELLRVARVLDPGGRIVYARVTAQEGGHVTRAATLAPEGTPLAEVFGRAAGATAASDFPVDDERVCAVVGLPESALDAEERVIVSAGLLRVGREVEAGDRGLARPILRVSR